MRTDFTGLGALAVAGVVGLATVGGAGVARGNLLVNGSFEANDASASPFFLRYSGSTSGQLTGWNTILDGVDLIHNNYTQPPTVLVDAQEGSQFLDMNASGALGGIYQDVVVVPGQVYTLSIYGSKWATNSGGSIIYSLIDPADGSVQGSAVMDLSSSTGWVFGSFDSRAGSGVFRVQVEATSATQAGPALDDVRLVAVPEPRFAWVLLTSGVLLAARRRRS